MTSFTVDPATLQELSSTLSGASSQMLDMHQTAAGYEGLLAGSDVEGVLGGSDLEGVLGGSDLEGEVGHFCDHWGYGIGQLGDQIRQSAYVGEEPSITA